MFCRKCGAELGINRSIPAAELPKPVVVERNRGIPLGITLAICGVFAGLAVLAGMKMTAPPEVRRPEEPKGIIAEPGNGPPTKQGVTPAMLWGALGLTVTPVSPSEAKLASLAPNCGAMAASVTGGSPASQAGVRQGDCIISVDLHPITGDPAAFITGYLARAKPGQVISLGICRQGRNTFANVTLR